MGAATKRSSAILLFLIGILLALPGHGNAETRTISWTAVTTYTDNTPIEPTKTVTYDVFWTTDIALSPASLHPVASAISQTSATFSPDTLGIPRGQVVYFTGDAVLNTGEKSAYSSPYTWNVPGLASLAISGPASVNENSSGTYTATATWGDGTTSTVTPTWTENSPYTTISTAGVLTTTAVTLNQTATIDASYTTGGVNRTAPSMQVTIVDLVAPLSISTASPLSSGTVGTAYSQTFAATGGTTPYSWSVSAGTLPAGLTLSSGGVLSGTPTAAGTSNFTVQATGGGTATKAFSVTIVNAPTTPAAPMNMILSGPVQTSPTKLYSVGWDPVTSNTDGSPIGAVTIRYSAYWTTDSGLSVGTLHTLATSISATSVTFDPAAEGMLHNQRVYLTARATLPTGEQSPLAEGLSWVAINDGPVPPANATIIKR